MSDPVWSGSVSAAAASVPRSLPVGVHRAASSAIAAAETLLFSYCSWDGSVKGGFHSAGSRKVITAVSSTSGSVSSAGSAGESSWSALPGAAPSSPDGSDSAVSALPLSAASDSSSLSAVSRSGSAVAASTRRGVLPDSPSSASASRSESTRQLSAAESGFLAVGCRTVGIDRGCPMQLVGEDRELLGGFHIRECSAALSSSRCRSREVPRQSPRAGFRRPGRRCRLRRCPPPFPPHGPPAPEAGTVSTASSASSWDAAAVGCRPQSYRCWIRRIRAAPPGRRLGRVASRASAGENGCLPHRFGNRRGDGKIPTTAVLSPSSWTATGGLPTLVVGAATWPVAAAVPRGGTDAFPTSSVRTGPVTAPGSPALR